MAPDKVLKQRMGQIQAALKKTPNVKVNCESRRMARINAILARGGPAGGRSH